MALLDWDQKVTMPSAGGESRAKQMESLSRIIHQRKTDPRFLDTVDLLAINISELSENNAINVREIKRISDRARKLPEKFVSERSRVTSLSYQAWVEARPKNDFETITNHLNRVFELCREEAELVGYQSTPYDALLDVYEPGSTLTQIKPLLLRLGEGLQVILPTLTEHFKQVQPPCGHYGEAAQRKLNCQIAQALGYSFDQGRLDATAHPFQETLGPNDQRITTRFNSTNYLSSLFTTLHEVGHALYEGGLPKQHTGTPLGKPISLSIHESQSRLWENMMGRSKEFCIYLYSLLKEIFPEEYSHTNPSKLWMQVNKVYPSLIRVEADEVSYSLHIIIRMLLEEEIINHKLSVSELPERWNALYKTYLGVSPENNQNGVMQDVHWFTGSVGYFPTYALGNLYAAAMYKQLQKDLPAWGENLERGKMQEITEWLRINVHQHGMKYRGDELIIQITNEPLSEKPFLTYLREKFSFSSEIVTTNS